jgi:pseudouridine-5'-phosphate glycosidase
MKAFLDINPEVRDALADGRAVVALESTVISHGLPHPVNLETAAKMEEGVRAQGAVPATIGLLEGRVVVGLSSAQIERLADDGNVAKVSRADFGPVLAAKRAGATTVAATMIVSAAAGIRFFATGGIGGVHRGAQTSFDISADLAELSRTPVAVVCAGPKAVLDIGLTLEVLETLGVPIVGFGNKQLPAFYSRESGFTLDYFCESPGELARLIRTHWETGFAAGVLVTNPPSEEFALGRDEVDLFIDDALMAAEREGVRGKAVTPFLLSRLADLSGGRTLAVNVALLENNARLAGLAAVEFTLAERG